MNLKSIFTSFAALIATATLSLAEHAEHKTDTLDVATLYLCAYTGIYRVSLNIPGSRP